MFKKSGYFLEQGLFLPAVKALQRGEIIAFETDTVPGVAVNALDTLAIQKLYALKNRCSEKKLVWMTDDWSRLEDYFVFSPQIYRLSQKLWPGPFTLIFQQRQQSQESRGEQIQGQSPESQQCQGHQRQKFRQSQGLQVQKQAVRIPQDAYLLHFLAQCPFPLAVTSANKSGDPVADSLSKVWDIFGEKITFYLPHAVASTQQPSLVLDVSEGACTILRQGDEKMLQTLQSCLKDVGLSGV